MAEMKPTLNDRTLALDDVKNKEDEDVVVQVEIKGGAFK